MQEAKTLGAIDLKGSVEIIADYFSKTNFLYMFQMLRSIIYCTTEQFIPNHLSSGQRNLDVQY